MEENECNKGINVGWWYLLIIGVALLIAWAQAEGFRRPTTRAECYTNCDQAYRGNPTAIGQCRQNCDRVYPR